MLRMATPARDPRIPAVPPGSRSAGLPLLPGLVERWRPPLLAIDPWTVLRLARYRRRDEVAPAIWETARSMAARAETLIEPVALFSTVGVSARQPDAVRLATGSVFSGRVVATLLAGCPVAAAFALTLGPRLETEVTALANRRELLESFLLDVAGWAAIEGAVRALRLDLRRRLQPAGWCISHRLAPGYRDWPLEEQPVLLGLLGETGGLVALSEHGVLVPFKSITGLFGLAPAPQTPAPPSPPATHRSPSGDRARGPRADGRPQAG
jgi:hypothetical protein